jgi:hypothetical protein
VKLGGAFGGLVFPLVADRDVAMSGDKFSSLLERAERHAKLPKLEGGLWHAYRRKWVTERKHWPLKDVLVALGSKDLKTLVTCYLQADDDTILAVMSEPKKVMEKAVSR